MVRQCGEPIKLPGNLSDNVVSKLTYQIIMVRHCGKTMSCCQYMGQWDDGATTIIEARSFCLQADNKLVDI